jgi:hypothetical protein
MSQGKLKEREFVGEKRKGILKSLPSKEIFPMGPKQFPNSFAERRDLS